MQALLLATLLASEEDWPSSIGSVLAAFEEETQRRTLFSVVFF